MNEEWKPVFGYEERYEVSTLGRIKTIERVGFHPKNKHGRPHRFVVRPRLLRSRKDRYGYVRVSLSNESGSKTSVTHRVVALTFLRDTWFEGAQVNHKNHKRDDNRLENLEWCTPKANVLHSFEGGRRVGLRGSQQPGAKLKESDIPKIREAIASGVMHKDIAKRFGVNPTVISAIRRGLIWKHVPKFLTSPQVQ